MTAEEECQPGGKGVHIQTRPNRCLHISNSVCQSKGHFLDSRATGLAHVIAADTDGIPSGDAIFAKCKNIGNDAHGFGRRIDVGSPRGIFFQDIVLYGPLKNFTFDPLFFRHREIHGQENGRCGIDRHRSGDLIQRDALKKNLHILQGINRHPDLSHFAIG